MLARQIHCISASSASMKRCFSSAGFIVNERRTSLHPDQADNIMVWYEQWKTWGNDFFLSHQLDFSIKFRFIFGQGCLIGESEEEWFCLFVLITCISVDCAMKTILVKRYEYTSNNWIKVLLTKLISFTCASNEEILFEFESAIYEDGIYDPVFSPWADHLKLGRGVGCQLLTQPGPSGVLLSTKASKISCKQFSLSRRIIIFHAKRFLILFLI